MKHVTVSLLLLFVLGLMIPNAFTESVPDWVKNTAGWWATSQITDSAFLQGIQYLIKEEIIIILPTEVSESVAAEKVPTWFKNNAGWWANSQINDSTFISGIQYLIKSGIIVVPQAEMLITETTVKASNYPDWLINNPSWVSAREFTNSSFDNFDTEYTDEKLTPCDNCVVTTNSLGFRGSEFSKDKSDKTYRIFAVGGSTTHGATLVNDDETWPVYLQQKFNQIDLEVTVEVINVGIMAATTEQEYKMVKDRLVDYNPDLIIMYDGWNDIQHLTVNKTIQNWQSVCELGIEKGFETIIILQPLAGTGNRVLTDHEHQNLNAVNIEKLHLLAENLITLNQYCAKTADFRGIFDYIQHPIFTDEGHTELLGNQIIAENIFVISLPIVSAENGLSYETKTEFPLHYYSSNTNKFTIYGVGADFTGRNFDGLYLKNAIFDKANLSNVSFRDSKLSEARLAFADLTGTDLSGIDFSNSNLAGTDLSKNILTETILRGTNLSYANLSGQDLSDKDLTDTVLRGANLSYANLGNFDFSGRDLTGVNLSGQDLSDKDLTDTVLRGANLSYANLENFDFSGRDLTGVNLSGQDLSSKDLTGTILLSADLTDAILPDSILSGNNFDSTVFNGMNLSGKDMSYSKFQYASFDNANLEGANLEDANFIQVDFTKIKNKSLAGADLFGTSFAHSNLSGVNLAGAILAQTNFWKASLSGLDFTVISDKSSHGSSFIYANLSDSNFEGVDLSHQGEYHKVFKNKASFVNLSDTDLITNLFGKQNTLLIVSKEASGNDLVVDYILFNNFKNANLENANFKNADLRFAGLYSADLTNADLSGADLRNAFLSNANLSNANLQGANLSDAIWNESTILKCKNHPICSSE